MKPECSIAVIKVTHDTSLDRPGINKSIFAFKNI